MPPATQLSKEEAVRLLRNGLAEQFRDLAASYVMPICWITAENGRPKLIDNGSAFMIDCGEGPFLVTAHHVYEGFRAARRSYPDAVCMLGDLRFDPEHRYIASDAAYDVATFRIEAQEIRQLKNYTNGKVVLTGSQQSWPPAPPSRGVLRWFPRRWQKADALPGWLPCRGRMDWLHRAGCGERCKRHRCYAGVRA